MQRHRLTFAITSVAVLVAAPVAVSATASASASPAPLPAAVAHPVTPKAAAAGGGFQIRSDQTGLCMSVAEDNSGPGAEIDMEPCFGGRLGQIWKFGPNGWVQPSVGTNLCLDNRWNNPGGGSGASTYPCTSGWTQEQWTYDGAGEWVNSNHNCLDVTDANSNPGAVVKLFGCAGVSNQHWQLIGV